MRTRMYGGVGGEEPRGFPLSRFALHASLIENVASGRGIKKIIPSFQPIDGATDFEEPHRHSTRSDSGEYR